MRRGPSQTAHRHADLPRVALFTGLHIHDRGDWNWSARHPVVRLDFAGGGFKDPGYLQTNLAAQLDGMEVATGVSPRYDTAPERFGYLIRSLHERSGQRVAVLVDEYDKPILDALETPEIARANRDYLRGLYGVIKARDAHQRNPIQMEGNRSRAAAAGLGERQPIHLTGVEFSRETRNVTAFEVADG